MIYYLVTPKYEHTMQNYLAHWAGELAPRFRIVTYDKALRAPELPLGTYVFADLERLIPAETEIATRVWEQLSAAGARLLNHPIRTLRRYELLKTLYARGRNRFRVVRATDCSTPLRFPVFIREEGEHTGSLSKLLQNQQQLDEALAGARFRGHRLETLMVVEYIDTVDKDGLYRKYAAFTVGGTVVSCHMDCSRGWMVKDTDIVNPQIVEEERSYVETNPHRAWLEETFKIAGVDYGRIDYGLLKGVPQVWEINTNPVVILTPDNYSEIHMPVKRRFAEIIRPAFEAIDSTATGVVRIDVHPALVDRLDFEKRQQERLRRHRSRMRRALHWGPVRFARAIRPMVSPILARVGRGRSFPRSR